MDLNWKTRFESRPIGVVIPFRFYKDLPDDLMETQRWRLSWLLLQGNWFMRRSVERDWDHVVDIRTYEPEVKEMAFNFRILVGGRKFSYFRICENDILV